MWNIKRAEEELAVPSNPSGNRMMMNPYELTKNELVRKLKFFGVYISVIVVVPKLLEAFGLVEPMGIPLTRR